MNKEKQTPQTLDPFQAWSHRWGRLGTTIALIYCTWLLWLYPFFWGGHQPGNHQYPVNLYSGRYL